MNNIVESDSSIIYKRLISGSDYRQKSILKKNDSANQILFKEHIIGSNDSKQNSNFDKIINDSFIISSDEAKMILNTSNIFTPEQLRDYRYTKFSKYGLLDIYNQHTFSREYLFFSKPDLHILSTTKSTDLYEPLSKLPFWINANEIYQDCIMSLQQTISPYDKASYRQRNNKYMQLLSNQVSSTLDLPGITATDVQNNLNLYQLGTSYREGSEVSDSNLEFTLSFNDTKYLDVYMLFKIYDEYIRETYKRLILPTKISYIDNKIDSKSFSIWKIIVDDTNTIIYYAKITGVYPTTVPRDSMSNFENTINEQVTFKGQFVRDMDPLVLEELNKLTVRSMGIESDGISNLNQIQGNYKEYTDKDNNIVYSGVNTDWGSFPIAVQVPIKRVGATDRDGYLYKLMWVKSND